MYAAVRVPTGLVDRWAPAYLLIAAACMAVAQLAFAFVSPIRAPCWRAILGCGDAMTFVSVVRFAAGTSLRRFPVSVTSMLDMAGNLAATIPLTLLLHTAGWTPSFAGTGLVSLATGVAVWALLPAEPRGARPRRPRGWSRWTGPVRSRAAGMRASGSGTMGREATRTRRARAWLPTVRRVSALVHAAWRTPGTRLGFWVHFSCMSLTTMFSVLWGVPYLVAQGFSPAAASGVLLVCVLAAMAISPAVGMVFGASRRRNRSRWRLPGHRGGLGALLACFGKPPHALIIAVAALMAAGGPASTIGFSLPATTTGAPWSVPRPGWSTSAGSARAILASLLAAGSGLAGAAACPPTGWPSAAQWLYSLSARSWQSAGGCGCGLLLGAVARRAVPVRVVERPFDRAAGHNAVRVSSREGRGAVSAARRVG